MSIVVQQFGQQPVANGAPAAYLNAQPANVLGQVGDGLQSLGVNIGKVAAKAKSEADGVAARNAVTGLRAFTIEDAYGENGYTKLSGPDLFSAAQERPQQLEQRSAEIREKLTPDQQALYDEQAAPVLLGYHKDLLGTLNVGAQQFRAESYKGEQSMIRNGRGAAAANGRLRLVPDMHASYAPGEQPPMTVSDGGIAADLAALDENARHRVKSAPGDFAVDAESAERILIEESHTAYHEATIRALLSADPAKLPDKDAVARAYLREHAKDITDTDVRTQLEAMTGAAYEAGETSRVATRAWASAEGDTLSERKANAVAGLTKDAPDGSAKAIGLIESAARQEQAKRNDDTFNTLDAEMTAGELTLPDMMKRPEFIQLSQSDPAKSRALVKIGQSYVTGEYAVTDPAFFNEVQTMFADAKQADKRADFNPRQYLGQGLSEADVKVVEGWKKDHAALGDSFISVQEAVNQRVSEMVPSNPDNPDAANVARGMLKKKIADAQVMRQRELKRPLNGGEMQELLDEQTTEFAFTYYTRPVYQDAAMAGGYKGGEARTQTVDSLIDYVPVGVQEQIRDELARNGMQATPEAIAAAYHEYVTDEDEAANPALRAARDAYFLRYANGRGGIEFKK